MLKAVGYDVQQAFYVNDLGAQIGLTALAYSRCYALLKPYMKARIRVTLQLQQRTSRAVLLCAPCCGVMHG
jgi:arginyl-tRNA synthetase